MMGNRGTTRKRIFLHVLEFRKIFLYPKVVKPVCGFSFTYNSVIISEASEFSRSLGDDLGLRPDQK